MDEYSMLVIAIAASVGTHFLMPLTLRARMVFKFGADQQLPAPLSASKNWLSALADCNQGTFFGNYNAGIYRWIGA